LLSCAGDAGAGAGAGAVTMAFFSLVLKNE
jgi:hypothetical protein